MPDVVQTLIIYALGALQLLLLFRLIMDYVFMFNRGYRPSGFMAVALEITYTITDPPLKLVRRFVPPLRLGNFAIDLAFMLVFIAVVILQGVVADL